MISTLISRLVILVFGTLFPAYYSYKAVKTKNVKEYVKWMMYWIVFAFFTSLETLTDIFLSFWFPFYYELKILVVLWLLSPATRGSSILYRKFVHPWLTQREGDIDNCIAQAKQQGYSAVLSLGSKGVTYATSVMHTAIKGGGGIMNQLQRSYSSGELITEDADLNRNIKPLPPTHPHHPYDDPLLHAPPPGHFEPETRMRAESDGAYRPRGSSAGRAARSSKTRSADVTDYFQETQEEAGGMRRRSPRGQEAGGSNPTTITASPPSPLLLLSADDLTSGYSSGADLEPDLDLDPQPFPLPEDDLLLPPYPPHHPLTRARTRTQPVRRTQSFSSSSSSMVGGRRGGEVRGGQAGSRGGQVSDAAPPACFSSSGHPPQQGAGFRRSRPGEVSAYATLPRATAKRNVAKKRQV